MGATRTGRAKSETYGTVNDPYVRENIGQLIALDNTNTPEDVATTWQTCHALCRRGLLFEQPAGVWHLKQAGRRVVDAWYAERKASGDGSWLPCGGRT